MLEAPMPACLSVLALAAVFAATPPGPPAGGWSWAVEVEAASSWRWRGATLRDSPVVQPGLIASRGSLELGAWASIGIGRAGKGQGSSLRPDLDEVDLSAGWSRATGRVTLEAVAVVYAYPASGDPLDGELILAADVDLPVALRVQVARSVTGAGTHLSLALGRRFELPRAALETSLTLGWADAAAGRALWGVHASSPTELAVELALEPARERGPGLRPFVRFTRLLPGPVSETVGTDHEVIAGIVLSFGG